MSVGEPILILGCGYTGSRVAAEMLRRGYPVTVTSRAGLPMSGTSALAFDITDPKCLERLSHHTDRPTRVLYSIPSVGNGDRTTEVLGALSQVRRVVYLSTTGVYGAQREVNEKTSVASRTRREQLRVIAEEAIQKTEGALILRPAGIYGPHRGIHTAMQAGTHRIVGDGRNFVSRIHVEDLSTHCVEGLLSDVEGAWPVADQEPATAFAIAQYCAELLNLPMPPRVPPEQAGETRNANRRVDGSAIRKVLGIELKYPSYRVGIPACIAAEAVERARARSSASLR